MENVYVDRLLFLDGKYHLYEADFATQTFTEIACGVYAKELEIGWLVGESDEKVSFYRRLEDKWQVIPVNTVEVDLLHGQIIYCQQGLWYVYYEEKEILLGEMEAAGNRNWWPLFPERARIYFVLPLGDDKFVLSIINPNRFLMQKEYQGALVLLSDASSFWGEKIILVPLGNDCFEAYDYAQPLLGSADEALYLKELENGVFFWSQALKCWKKISLQNCYVLANNAVLMFGQRKTGFGGYYRFVILYKVDENANCIKICVGKKCFLGAEVKIGGWFYPRDIDKKLVDFDHPRKSRWLKIKNFFGLGKD